MLKNKKHILLMSFNIFYLVPILLFGTIYIYRIILDITKQNINK